MNTECYRLGRAARAIAAFFVMFTLLTAISPVVALADYTVDNPESLSDDDLDAYSAIVVSANGRSLYEKDADTRRYPASTTKIMTAILALENTSDLDQVVTVPSEAGQVPGDSSLVGLYIGEQITMRDLIYSFFICSGNDAGNALAVLVGGSLENFVQLMNAKAAQLGCSNTHFANAHGYHDENHYTTARDMSKIAVYAMQNTVFRDVCSTTKYTIPASNKRSEPTTFWTKNQFIARNDTSMLYKYIYGVGIKTGYTSKAGQCFVGAAVKDGVSLISVVLHSTQDGKWKDSIKLMEYGFATYKSYDPIALYNQNPVRVQIENAAQDDSENGVLTLAIVQGDNTPSVCGTQAEIDQVTQNFTSSALVEYTRSLSAPISAGEIVGNLIFRAPNESEVIYRLAASRGVSAQSAVLPQPTDGVSGTTAASGGNSMAWLIPVLLLAGVAALLVAARLGRRHGRRRGNRNYISQRDDDWEE